MKRCLCAAACGEPCVVSAPDVGASKRHQHGVPKHAFEQVGAGPMGAGAGARGRRYAADKLTELVSAALEAGADAGTLASLQVPRALPAPLHAPVRRSSHQCHPHHVPMASKLLKIQQKKPLR